MAGLHPNLPPIIGELTGDLKPGLVAAAPKDGPGLLATASTGSAVYAVNKGPGYAGEFDGAVQINGTLRVSSDLTVDQDVILSVAARDCAEDFEVSSSGDIEPGTVMVMDDDGALRPSEHDYDRRVAGVVSGAGGYRPGVILGRTGSPEPRVPLALIGKVFCKADAQYGSIAVGDLLTTSPTEGHAMKASDHTRAFGAVIGKALSPLSEGTGFVPILIALQ
jgi:hypothetical protein